MIPTRFSSVLSSIPHLETITVDPRDIQLQLDPDHPSKLSNASLSIAGLSYIMSDRFEGSLLHLLGTNREIFDLFELPEVTQRAIARGQIGPQRLTIENRGGEERHALGMVSAALPLIGQDEIMEILTRTGAKHIAYAEGLIEGFYDVPRDGELEILGDRYVRGFRVAHPLDGYGLTEGMVTLWRQACQNGMIADYGAFAQTIPFDKSESGGVTLERYIRSFAGLDAFAAFQMRLEAARRSPASVAEVAQLHRVVFLGEEPSGAPWPQSRDVVSTRVAADAAVSSRFDQMAGTVTELYGVAAYHDIPKKRQRLSPMRATVNDLMNFATEFSTHHASTGMARRLDAWLGRLITQEYDLEGTLKAGEQPRDLFLRN